MRFQYYGSQPFDQNLDKSNNINSTNYSQIDYE